MNTTVLLHVKTHAPHLNPKPEMPSFPDDPSAPQPKKERKSVTFIVPINLSPLWEKLHLRALDNNGVNDTKWLDGYARLLPCGECRKHWNGMIERSPPVWDNYFAWTVDRHNEVNTKLKKPLLSIEEARAKWTAADISKPVN